MTSFLISKVSSFKLQWCFLCVLIGATSGQLSSTFYSSSCSNALSTIQSAVQSAVNNEARMGASLLRLHFHDCFVNVSLKLIISWCMHVFLRKTFAEFIHSFYVFIYKNITYNLTSFGIIIYITLKQLNIPLKATRNIE